MSKIFHRGNNNQLPERKIILNVVMNVEKEIENILIISLKQLASCLVTTEIILKEVKETYRLKIKSMI